LEDRAQRDPKWPIVQLEYCPQEEAVTGIVKGQDIPIIGAAVIRVTMSELGKDSGPDLLLRCKIFKKG
jgi:hypothetical protein